MSKAFTKEDDEIPERVSRERSSSGLPPGAVNYITEEGASRLRGELDELEKHARRGKESRAEAEDGSKTERMARLRGILDSATIVPTREAAPEEVLFGTMVTVRTASGELHRHRIVGGDETALGEGWVSWVSPVARVLLGAQVGQQVQLPDGSKGEVVGIGI